MQVALPAGGQLGRLLQASLQPRLTVAQERLSRVAGVVQGEPARAGLATAHRAAASTAAGVRRVVQAVLVEGDVLDAPGRSAARALDRLHELTRPERRPARGEAVRRGPRTPSPRSRNGAGMPIDARRMGFGLPDAAARVSTGVEAPAGTLARVIELPLALPEALSPELALVDPELGRLARARLHEPGAFWPGGARPQAATAGRRLAAAVPVPSVRVAPPPAVAAAAAELLAERTAVSRADRFFQPVSPSSPAAPGGMAAVAAALLLGVGVGGGLAWVLPDRSAPSSEAVPAAERPRPAGVSADPPSVIPPATSSGRSGAAPAPASPTVARPAAPAPAPVPAAPEAPSGGGTQARAPEARTFAWAPAPGATGYEVQLFRGDDRVFLARTKQPRLTIGPRWEHEGRAVTLRPGQYRWYVWPLGAGGTRAETPVVQARVLIAAR